MDLASHVERLRHEFGVAAGAGGEDVRALAELLIAPLESAVRLVLLEALSEAADSITRELAPGSVEMRLRGRELSFAVTPALIDEDDVGDTADHAATHPLGGGVGGVWFRGPVPEVEDGAMTRINLRLPEALRRPPSASGCRSTPGWSAPSQRRWLPVARALRSCSGANGGKGRA